MLFMREFNRSYGENNGRDFPNLASGRPRVTAPVATETPTNAGTGGSTVGGPSYLRRVGVTGRGIAVGLFGLSMGAIGGSLDPMAFYEFGSGLIHGDSMNQASPVPVDFGNRDEDGAVRLVTRGTVEYLKSRGIALSEGLPLLMSDGELTAEGTCTLRQGMWVAVISRWLS
jgi:hypothetical protein